MVTAMSGMTQYIIQLEYVITFDLGFYGFAGLTITLTRTLTLIRVRLWLRLSLSAELYIYNFKIWGF